jgi:agmatine deiminase
MLYFSSLLKTDLKYSSSAKNLFFALSDSGEKFTLFDGAKDIWARDFMPVKTKSGKYVSFRYEPSYLAGDPQLRTNFKTDIAPHFVLPVTYSNINLDGGNVVFSPSKTKAVITDRVFSENPEYDKNTLLLELEKLLEASVLIIPSLKSDMTGHADGMVRFVSENTVVANAPLSPFGFETKVKKALQHHGIEVLDFPYFDSNGNSAIGCYLNFIETGQAIFLPVFSVDTDNKAVQTAKHIFHKAIIPVNINEIAADGGLLNCISWET